jgi:hypothetical protein
MDPNPCPLCRIEIVDVNGGTICREEDQIEATFVLCDNCGFQMSGADRDEVIGAWNRAAKPSELGATWPDLVSVAVENINRKIGIKAEQLCAELEVHREELFRCAAAGLRSLKEERETAFDRVRRFVDYKYTGDCLVHQSELVDISSGDLRDLVDEIAQLRAMVEAYEEMADPKPGAFKRRRKERAESIGKEDC